MEGPQNLSAPGPNIRLRRPWVWQIKTLIEQNSGTGPGEQHGKLLIFPLVMKFILEVEGKHFIGDVKTKIRI